MNNYTIINLMSIKHQMPLADLCYQYFTAYDGLLDTNLCKNN